MLDLTVEYQRSHMKGNMGILDRIIRVALVAVVAVLYFTGQLSLVASIILGALAVIFLLTSITGVCPPISRSGSPRSGSPRHRTDDERRGMGTIRSLRCDVRTNHKEQDLG